MTTLIPYCFKYICEFIRGISPSSILDLSSLELRQLEGGKSVEKRLVLLLSFFPTFPLREKSNRLAGVS